MNGAENTDSARWTEMVDGVNAGGWTATAPQSINGQTFEGYGLNWLDAFANEHVVNSGGGEQEAYGNPLNAERLRVSIQANMGARGIQLVDRAQADCMVGYAMGSRQVFDTYYGGYGSDVPHFHGHPLAGW